MSFWSWSRTAGSNASADSTINWAEGQPPSSVNDSARAMMARTAEYRDDIAGAIATGGTSTAYTVTSYQVFDTLAHMANQIIAFTPHTTNGATVTLNVDSLGAKALRSAPNVELPAGTLIQGTPYVAVYNNSDAAWYLHGFYGNPYNIPIAGSIEFWGATSPNSSFVLPYGQAISRTTYSTLFGIVGTTYGSGDGSTTFNLPDCRGRVIGCTDAMGGSDAGRLTGGNMSGRLNLGGSGGEATHTLTTTEMPSHSHGVTDPTHSHTFTAMQVSAGVIVSGGTGSTINPTSGSTSSAATGISIQNTGGGVAHNVIQPTILCNRIMRII